MSEEVKGEQKAEEGKNEFLGTMEECGERAEYHNLVDILFVIDATGSMSWCISQMKKTVCKIMKKFSDKQYNIKFAIELYRDHPPQEYSYIEKHFDLRNQDDIIKVIDEECDVAGGGDTPEAVFDGLINGLKKTKWRVSTDGKTKSKRFLFHGCDAPPHGKEYGCTSSDAKWTQNGAPSGFTRHDVKKLLDQYNVDYSLIKCGAIVDTMAALFKECFAQRFKRELEIKQESRSYGGKRGLERKSSIKYMEQIERQERAGSELDQYQQQEECSAESPRLCVDEVDRPIQLKECKEQKKSFSFLESIKSVFRPESKKSKPPPPVEKAKKRKVKVEKEKKEKKEVQKEKAEGYESNSSDEGEGRPRSMASLVLSDIEDGIDKHFDQPQKKEKKVTKDI